MRVWGQPVRGESAAALGHSVSKGQAAVLKLLFFNRSFFLTFEPCKLSVFRLFYLRGRCYPLSLGDGGCSEDLPWARLGVAGW